MTPTEPAPAERRPIHALWLAFRARCVPKGAPEVQLESMRDSFYAGAYALFGAMNQEVSEGDDITARDIAFMEAVEHDLTSYPERRLVEAP